MTTTNVSQEQNTVEIEQMVVDIAHLDSLLNLTGEIIINSTNLDIIRKYINESHVSNSRISPDCLDMIKNATLMSRRISQDLHNLVMDVRLIKIKEAFQRFRRPVRSISKALGKEIQLLIEGEETPIDKTIVEKICNPLDHLIRNAIDHGMEDPLDRKKAGKNVEGTLTLKAYLKQKATYIEVIDDGRGIDAHKISEKAVEKELITQAEADALSQEETFALLFQPGFSTAAKATDISGRGVGLDVVKTAVEELNGTVHIESTIGVGTKFVLKIPQLSAVNITDALTVQARGTYYAIPIESVLATLEVRDQQITNICKNETIQYYEKVIPLYDLVDLLEGRVGAFATNKPTNIEKVLDKISINKEEQKKNDIYNVQTSVEQPVENNTETIADGIDESTDAVDSKDTKKEHTEQAQKQDDNETQKQTTSNEPRMFKVIIITHKLGTIGLKVDALLSPQKFVVFPWDDLYMVKGLLGSTIIGGNTLGLILNPADLIEMTMDELAQSAEEKKEDKPKKAVQSIEIQEDEDTTPEKSDTSPKEESSQLSAEETLAKNKEFFFELKGLLTDVNDHIFKLEKNPKNEDLVHSIFRYLHSIKGDIVMMGYDKFAAFVHDVETILDRIREKELEISEVIIDILLDTVDELTRFLEMIGNSKVPGHVSDALVKRVDEYKRQPEMEEELDITGQDFILQPFEEFSIQTKKRAGKNIFQVYLDWKSTKQTNFVLAYLILRKMAESFDILASFPRINEIEKGICSNNIKIFIASDHEQKIVENCITRILIPYYDVNEYEIIQTT